MTTTLSIDKEIRDKAYIRAKKDKISLSAVARMLLLDYAEWRISIWTRINNKIDENSKLLDYINSDEYKNEERNFVDSDVFMAELKSKIISWK